MTVIDSRQSSDNNENADCNTINSASTLNADPDDHVNNTHGYFIPAVITIVFSVVVISTFNGKVLKSQVTGSAPHNQAVELTSNTADRSITTVDTSGESEAIADPPAITQTADDHRQASEVTSSMTETMVADSTPVTAAPSSSATSAEQGLSQEISQLDTQKHPVLYPDSQNRITDPVPPPVSYGVPEHLQTGYYNIWEQRRIAYQAMLRARHEHMIKMNEYRAAELRRIEQHRKHWFKRMHALEKQGRNRRDELILKVEQQETRAMNHPI